MSGHFAAAGEDMPTFEVFNRRTAPSTTQPLVTIQKRGTMSLNRSAFEALGEPDAVELLYDREERLLGFRPVDPAVPHAYRPRKQGNAANYILAGQAFTQYYGVETGTARRYRAKLLDDVLVVDLKQPGTDATGPRARDTVIRSERSEENRRG